jgi:hypothetical protein
MVQDKEFKLIPVSAAAAGPNAPAPAPPELLGFAGPDMLIAQASRKVGNLHLLDVVNVRSGSTANKLKILSFDRLLISPDGQKIAVAAVGPDAQGIMKGGIDTWNLLGPQPRDPLKTAFPDFKWVKPNAMAFTPNNTQAAAFFEDAGRGVLYVFPAIGAGTGKTLTFRELPYPPEVSADFHGRGIDFVPLGDGTFAVILFGRAVIDAESGAVLGDLGLSNPHWQRTLDKDTLLVEMLQDGKPVIAQVKLKLDEIIAKRLEARGGKRPTPPAGK